MSRTMNHMNPVQQEGMNVRQKLWDCILGWLLIHVSIGVALLILNIKYDFKFVK